jgi:hypothetical protein
MMTFKGLGLFFTINPRELWKEESCIKICDTLALGFQNSTMPITLKKELHSLKELRRTGLTT